jgi:SH3 domain protein
MKIMNPFGLFVMLLFLISHTAVAETKYVIEHLQVNARSGSSLEHKSITMLESGQAVQVLGVDKDWSHVKLSDGKEGWILSRFLTTKEPRKLVLEKLQKKYDQLDEQVNLLLEENRILNDENRIMKSELVSNKEALDEIKKKYEELKQGSSEYIRLKNSEQEAVLKLQEMTSRVENWEKEASGFKKQQNIRWFLAGSGVLFLGFLVGSISKRKRRSSSLY